MYDPDSHTRLQYVTPSLVVAGPLCMGCGIIAAVSSTSTRTLNINREPQGGKWEL